MLKSIRWTTQLWHGAILAGALVAFGLALDVTVRRGQEQALDSSLERSAHALASRLDHGPRDEGPFGFHDGPGHHDGPGDHDGPGHHEGPGHPDGPGDRDPDGPPLDEGPPSGDAGFRGRAGFDTSPVVRARVASIAPDALDRVGADEGDQLYFVVCLADGSVGRASPNATDVPPPEPLANRRSGPHDPATFRDRGAAREVLLSGPWQTRILVGSSRQRERAELARLHEILGVVGLCVLGVGLFGGWVLAGRVLRPIAVVSETARSISATDLSRRIEVPETESELGGLASTLNATFDRLEAAFARQVRFTADASHELRTPLAVVHSHAQIALSRPRTAEEYRVTIETCLRATTRMKALVESLLVLARADAQRLELSKEKVDLAPVVREVAGLLQPIADGRRVTVELELAPTIVEGDRARLTQVVTNLVGNAIHYNNEGGKVRVALRTSTSTNEAELAVSDTGIGIAREDQPRVFERFFRADPARSREGGTGLGLAICSSIVTAHGGRVSFESEPAKGSTFTVRLPLVS